MSIPKSRVGDQVRGTCVLQSNPFTFTGVIISGAQTVTVDGTPASNQGAQAMTDCADCQIVNVISGSGTVTAEGMGCTRLGDQVTGPSQANGNVVIGSPDVTAS